MKTALKKTNQLKMMLEKTKQEKHKMMKEEKGVMRFASIERSRKMTEQKKYCLGLDRLDS